MTDTRYLDPEFAQKFWQEWGAFLDTAVETLQSLNNETSAFLGEGLQGDISNKLISKQRILYDGMGGIIDHVQIQSVEMQLRLIYAADEICNLDLLLSESYNGGGT